MSDDKEFKNDEMQNIEDKKEKESKEDSELASKIKQFIVTTGLVGTSVIGLDKWHSQAHGNRSSHNFAEIRWKPEDFVVRKSEVLELDGPLSLPDLKPSDLDTFIRNTENIRRDMFESRFKVIDKNGDCIKEVQNFNQYLQNLIKIGEHLDDKDKKKNALNKLQDKGTQISYLMTPYTKNFLAFYDKGDIEGARKYIESIGDSEKIMEAYIWIQLDLHNLGMEDGKSTTVFVNEISEVSDLAENFYNKQKNPSIALKKSYAGVLNNLASFTIPDVGEVDSKTRLLGTRAALRAIDLRVELGDKESIERANWIAGVHYLKKGDTSIAKSYFDNSIQIASEIKNVEDLGWGKLYKGLALRGENSKEAEKLIQEARKLFQDSKNDYALKHLDDVTKK